jgi:hypothetical protein
MSIFEQASRQKIRFPSTRGELTVEQLWDLPLQSKSLFDLDNIAKAVSREVKAVSEESFVTESSPANAKLTLALDVVKHIISVRKSENRISLDRAARMAERDKLLEILSDKNDAALKELSPEQIKARLESLGV